MKSKVSLGMLAVGIALLWPVPLGGALVLVTAAIGFAIAWEAELVEGPAMIERGPQLDRSGALLLRDGQGEGEVAARVRPSADE